MGKDGDGLYYLVVDLFLDFHEHQGQNDGHDGACGNEQHVQENRVEEDFAYSLVVKQELEVLQSHPGAAPDAVLVVEVLKGDQYAVHGVVAEYQYPDNGGKRHEVQQFVLPQFLQPTCKAQVLFVGSVRLCLCLFHYTPSYSSSVSVRPVPADTIYSVKYILGCG